jgi:hypothetical protein
VWLPEGRPIVRGTDLSFPASEQGSFVLTTVSALPHSTAVRYQGIPCEADPRWLLSG